jgi:hypothetical protein
MLKEYISKNLDEKSCHSIAMAARYFSLIKCAANYIFALPESGLVIGAVCPSAAAVSFVFLPPADFQACNARETAITP